MSRLRISTRDETLPENKLVLDGIYRRLGVVPNLFRLIGNSPAALEAFTSFQEGLSRTLDRKTRERIAIAVAQVNGSDYCLSVHTYLATNFARLSPDEIALNRQGHSQDPKADKAVKFAATVAERRGHVGDVDIADVKLAGYEDAEIVEIVALVAESSFTNYLNEVAKTDIDFPLVRTDPLR